MFYMAMTMGTILAWLIFEWLRRTRPPNDALSQALREEYRRSRS